MHKNFNLLFSAARAVLQEAEKTTANLDIRSDHFQYRLDFLVDISVLARGDGVGPGSARKMHESQKGA